MTNTGKLWESAATAALLALAVSPALAQEQTPADNIEARAGNLRILHVWTTDPDGFRERFARPDNPELAVSLTAERNQPIRQFILYANCQRDPDDHCWLTAKVNITAPDGTPYGEPMAFDALPLGPAVPIGRIGMAPGSIGLVVEDGEQLGRYRVELAVTDEIAVQTATSVVHLDIVEQAAGKDAS